LLHCLNAMTDDQIWWRPNEQSNSVGNLVLHLCGNLKQWIVASLGGQKLQTANRNRSRFLSPSHRESLSLVSASQLIGCRGLRAQSPPGTER
jgi:hypothetical protein